MHSNNHHDPTEGAGPSISTRRPHQMAIVRIVEQPAAKALRFRYECEGRSAGSIPGTNSTPENKTFPTIRIEGYQGRAVVVVSCVTKDPPYRPHPHNLVGREGCKKGVCTMEVSLDTMTVQFSNLGIQCIKKKEIESALKVREEIRVDPFRTGFSHRSQPTSIDLNAVRLAFQVFLQNEKSKGFTHPLSPIVSDPIYDKKAMTDLNIIKISDCNSPVDGGHKDIILLCEKVAKEDIQVRFYEEKDGVIVWEAFGDFQPSQVHKQTAIWFRTPRYRTLDITEPVRVNIQLRRPSDGATSVPLPFEMLPLDAGRPAFWSMRRNMLLKKGNYNLFSGIMANDAQLCNAAKRKHEEIGEDIKDPIEVVDISNDHDKDTKEPEETNDVDHTLSDLIREVSELDEIYEDNQRRINEIDQQVVEEEEEEEEVLSTTMKPHQESFDDSKTYSSLQMAFKNPVRVVDIDMSDKYEDVIVNPLAPVIDISDQEKKLDIQEDGNILPPLPPKRAKKVIETYIGQEDHDGDALPQQENIAVSNGQLQSLKYGSSQQILTPAPIPLSRSNSLNSAPPLPEKRLPPLPGATNTLPNPKKRGFFSKIFGKKQPKSESSSLRNSQTTLQISTQSGLNRTHSKPSIIPKDIETEATKINNNLNLISNSNDNKEDNIDPALLETDDFNMNLDLTEAEHYALYTAIAPHATQSEFDETSCYYAPVEGGRLLPNAEFMNHPGVLKRKRQKFESDPSNSLLRHFQDHEKNRQIQITNDMIKHEPRDTSPAPYMFSPVYVPNPNMSPHYGYRNPVVDTLGATPPPADLHPVYAGATTGMLPPIGNMLNHGTQWNITSTNTNNLAASAPPDLSTISMQLEASDPNMILNLDSNEYFLRPININSGDLGALYDTNNLSENLSMNLSLSDIGGVGTISGSLGGRTYQNDSDSLTNLANRTLDRIYNNKVD